MVGAVAEKEADVNMPHANINELLNQMDPDAFTQILRMMMSCGLGEGQGPKVVSKQDQAKKSEEQEQRNGHNRQYSFNLDSGEVLWEADRDVHQRNQCLIITQASGVERLGCIYNGGETG